MQPLFTSFSSHLAIAHIKTSDLRVEGQSLSTLHANESKNYRARAVESKIIQHTAIHQSSQSQPLPIMSENATPPSTPPPTPSTPPPPAPPSTFSVELMTTEVAIPPALARIEPVRIIYAFSFEAPQARDRRDERHTQEAGETRHVVYSLAATYSFAALQVSLRRRRALGLAPGSIRVLR